MHDICDMCGQVVPEDQLMPMGAGSQVCAQCAEKGSADGRAEKELAQRDYVADMAMDARRMGEGVGFDKFMDRILVNEGHLRAPTREEDSPQRRRAARHQDRPLNKIRFGGK